MLASPDQARRRGRRASGPATTPLPARRRNSRQQTTSTQRRHNAASRPPEKARSISTLQVQGESYLLRAAAGGTSALAFLVEAVSRPWRGLERRGRRRSCSTV